VRFQSSFYVALISGLSAAAAAAPAQAQDLVFNQYSVYRISPTAKYFTPGSIMRGYNYKGVLKVEIVCRNKIDVMKDDNILRDNLVSAGFFSESGFQFNVSANVTTALNADFGANLVNTVTIAVTDAVVYEYSAEDLNSVRKELLSRPACAEAVANPRNKYREFNGAPAGLFQNQRFVLGNITYKVEFNKGNPKAASLNVQAQVTKQLQVKFGLTHLNASGSELKGENVVIGLNPVWQPNWGK
jgi:hypothetical protein